MRSRLTSRPASRAQPDDGRDALGIVRAIEGGQHVRHSGLHAERDPRESAVGQASQVVGTDGVGVGLRRDLGTGREAELVAHGPEHPHEVIGGQEGRRPAAEEDGRRGASGHAGCLEHAPRHPDLADGVVGVVDLASAAELLRRVGVEVAVAATDAAEGHVHVHPEGAAVRTLGRRGAAVVRRVGRARRAAARIPWSARERGMQCPELERVSSRRLRRWRGAPRRWMPPRVPRSERMVSHTVSSSRCSRMNDSSPLSGPSAVVP